MKKDSDENGFKAKCEQLGLELLSFKPINGKLLVGCNIHGGAWSVGVENLNLKNKLLNCGECFTAWLTDGIDSH